MQKRAKEAEKIEPSSSPETAPPADRLCGHPSACTNKATHGVRGSRKRELCIEHAKNTPLLYLSGYWCNSPGCDQWPSFGSAGRARDYCRAHAKMTAGMVNVSSRLAAIKTPPAPRELEIGIKRELTCEKPRASSTLRRGDGVVEILSEGSRRVDDTRPREPPHPPEPSLLAATFVGGAAGAEQGNQAEPIDAAAASQADVVEPFMGFKKRRRRVDRVRALVLEAGVQVEPGSCEEAKSVAYLYTFRLPPPTGGPHGTHREIVQAILFDLPSSPQHHHAPHSGIWLWCVCTLCSMVMRCVSSGVCV